MDLYVYYKVREQDALLLAPRVRALLARLAKDGVAGSLKRRPEAKDGMQTWMEVYPGVDGGFAARLEQAALEAGLAQYTSGPRRLEVFIDLDEESKPCA